MIVLEYYNAPNPLDVEREMIKGDMLIGFAIVSKRKFMNTFFKEGKTEKGHGKMDHTQTQDWLDLKIPSTVCMGNGHMMLISKVKYTLHWKETNFYTAKTVRHYYREKLKER